MKQRKAIPGKRVKTRYKIALLVGSSVMLAMLLTLLIFNVGTRRMIGTGAAQAIEAAIQEDYETSQTTTYQAEVFGVPDSTYQKEYDFWLTQTERNLINYYRNHDIEENAVIQARVGSKSYYFAAFDRAAAIDNGESSDEWADQDGAEDERADQDGAEDERADQDGAEDEADFDDPMVMIAYVDVSGEPEMITRLSIYILIAALIIAAGGSLLGFLIGKRLEENEASKQHFFENTSHELKTPLAVIRGYAEGIQTGVITDYRKAGKVIASQSEKMSSLVEDILLMSKIEGGSEPLHKENVNMEELVQDCLMPLEEMVNKRGLDVQLDLTPIMILADPDRMEHAVTNLLVNAVKYAKSQIRVELTGEQGNRRSGGQISGSGSGPGDGQLRIWNDYEALTKDDIGHIFERFYTGSNGNTGIGLALAKEIIEKHGFAIKAEGVQGGLMITVTFHV